MTLTVHVLEGTLDYDGSQLASLFAYRTAGVQGDSVVAFHGACRVTPATMVDLEDLRQGARIESPEMLHFIAERFGAGLEEMVLRQRLFGRLAATLVQERGGRTVRVAGDDLFIDDRKLSISIATVSPVSALFHFALNVRTEGVPVPAAGLGELGIPWRPLADDLLRRFQDETDDVRRAATKVRWVR